MIDKPKVLFVAHNSVLGSSFGGVEAYINTLTKHLKSEYDIYWYVPYCGDDGVGVQLIGPDIQKTKTTLLKTSFENWQLNCPEREDAFIKVLKDLDIEVVHFHHLSGHPPSLVKVAKENGAHTVFTFHDYYSLCHVSNLMNFEDKYCQPDKIPLSSCDECLEKKYSILPGSQQIRRGYWNELFKYLDGLIFNTQGSFSLVSKIYPTVASHPNVAIMPVAIEEVSRPQLPPKSNDELKVAILGNLNHHKGANVIIEAIEQLSDENISFHFFGEIDSVYDEKLDLSKNLKIYRHGKYPPGELPKELFSCDISIHVSICPETYGLTLSEAWSAGLVPIVSDIGALGERVREGFNGLKIEVGSSTALMNEIIKISTDRKILALKHQKDISSFISTMDKHAIDLLVFYAKTLDISISDRNDFSIDVINDVNVLNWAIFNKVSIKRKQTFLSFFRR